jgi:hypothetical protein
MQLAGIPVRDEDVFKLAGGGFEVVADKLDHAPLLEMKVLALTVTDRESLLRALDGSSRVSQAGSRLVLGAFVRTAGRWPREPILGRIGYPGS